MIAILDYETAQTQALHEALSRLGVKHERVDALAQLDRASRIILPAGGDFADMIRDIRDGGYLPALFRAQGQGRPILGISQGMHLLFDVAYDSGQHTGLGLIPGKVTSPSIPARSPSAESKAPVKWTRSSVLVHGINSGESFHFDADSAAEPLDRDVAVGETTSGYRKVAVVEDGSIFGTQFLPERSGAAGDRVLANFARVPLR